MHVTLPVVMSTVLLYQAHPNLRLAEHLCGIRVLVHVSASGFIVGSAACGVLHMNVVKSEKY
jgi:folate-dependent tRNA-U54 methylase TrmFO/GidA